MEIQEFLCKKTINKDNNKLKNTKKFFEKNKNFKELINYLKQFNKHTTNF